MIEDREYLRELIVAELGVSATFDVDDEIERRVAFLVERLRASGAGGFVLGISGGVDSSTAGRLCQLAVERIRAGGVAASGRPGAPLQATRAGQPGQVSQAGQPGEAFFVAMRLPYGVQRDEEDAKRALEFIRPDETLTVDVKPATDAMVEALRHTGLGERAAFSSLTDFHAGNIKARQRMIAQYAVAGARGGLVVGTDHAAEAVTGFFTKYGDGGFDLTALSGLTKRRVRAIAERLGATPEISGKVPTADLETDRPGLPDEEALGVSYDEIDDFLEGKEVSDQAAETIIRHHRRTAHKRALPFGV